MRRVVYIILFVVPVVSGSFIHKDLNEYGKWLKFYGLVDEDFQQIGAEKQKGFGWQPYELTKEGAKEYDSLFFYSKDSTYFLDLDSYNLVPEKDASGRIRWQGGDPEDKAQIVRTKDGSACVLLFFGSAGNAKTAIWRSNDLFEIMGVVIDADKFIPTIWKYDLSKRVSKTFQSNKTFKPGRTTYLYEVRLKVKDK